MKLKEKLGKFFKDPRYLLVYLNNKGIVLLSDEKYISFLYKLSTKKDLNLSEPVTYNEKLQWLKLNHRNDSYSTMVDKYEAKKYVGDIIGEQYIIPTYGVYDKFDDIDFDKLPNKFVLKCTHDSGGVVICKDKKSLNINSAKRKINRSMKRNYYYATREWPYKTIKPRIIVEKYMENDNQSELTDYKFFCFNGKIGVVLTCTNRQKNLELTWYDTDFNYIDLKVGDSPNNPHVKKPETFEEMKRIAQILSEGIPHVRVDLYEINSKVYFGEMTFFPVGGLVEFEKEEWDKMLGDMIDLNLAKNE